MFFNLVDTRSTKPEASTLLSIEKLHGHDGRRLRADFDCAALLATRLVVYYYRYLDHHFPFSPAHRPGAGRVACRAQEVKFYSSVSSSLSPSSGSGSG